MLWLRLGQGMWCARLTLVPQDLAAATAKYRAAQQRVDSAKSEVQASQQGLREARTELAEALVAEARRGSRMRDLVATTGLSREWIRTRLRQAGVLADD